MHIKHSMSRWIIIHEAWGYMYMYETTISTLVLWQGRQSKAFSTLKTKTPIHEDHRRVLFEWQLQHNIMTWGMQTDEHLKHEMTLNLPVTYAGIIYIPIAVHNLHNPIFLQDRNPWRWNDSTMATSWNKQIQCYMATLFPSGFTFKDI